MGRILRISAGALVGCAFGWLGTPVEGASPSVVPAVPAVTESPTSLAAATVRRVQARYDETETLSGRFVQEVAVGVSGRVIRSGGTLRFHKPGRMRWEYESSAASEHQILIADGETLWIHQPEQAQVLRAPLAQAFASRTPVSFLFGVARLEEDFTAELLSPADDGSLRLRLHPKPADGASGSDGSDAGAAGVLVLEVDPESHDLRAAIVRDPLGNETRVALVGMQRNLELEDSLFVFKRPPGTDLQQAPGGG